jgi:hypothetical protein
VWQQVNEQYGSNDFEIVAVAMDAQGADKPRPFMQKAGATFRCLLDSENLLAKTFGFKAVPNGILVDEQGNVVYQKFGGFDIQKPETRQIIETWLGAGSVGDAESTRCVGLDGRVLMLFDEGLAAYRGGDVEGARANWREASVLDPHNYVIHKQLWAIENPERFYGERVDMAWQKEQLAQGD